MPSILIAECIHEVCSFNPVPTRYDDFSIHIGQTWFAGTTAVLQADNITLVVTTRPVHLYDRSLFLAHGLDPRHFDLVVVKSPHCQPHMYADWCARLINVDAPGSTSANLPTLGHTRCRRPIFPLDGDVPFTPKVMLFSRRGKA